MKFFFPIYVAISPGAIFGITLGSVLAVILIAGIVIAAIVIVLAAINWRRNIDGMK